MRPTTPDRIRDQFARAEAWRAYALRQRERAEYEHDRWADAEMYAIRAESEVRDEVVREMEHDAREESRAAYGEGYSKGREDGGEGGW